MRTATTSPSDERGFTLVELTVTFAILAVVATAIIGVAMRAFTDTNTITDRRDVFAEGRTGLDRLSKQLRQAESIDTAWSTPSRVRFTSYIDGATTIFVWRVAGSGSSYRLEESRNGGTSYSTVVSSLAAEDVFVYTAHEGVTDQVTINLDLSTRTTTVELTSDVFLRNT